MIDEKMLRVLRVVWAFVHEKSKVQTYSVLKYSVYMYSTYHPVQRICDE